jgi:hypothetical protein
MDHATYPETSVALEKGSSSIGELSTSRNPLTVAHAAASLNSALGSPVSDKAVGFFAELWAFVVAFATALWRSVTTAWKPGNYLALISFFVAGVLFAEMIGRYVRAFSAIAVVVIGVLVIMGMAKKQAASRTIS